MDGKDDALGHHEKLTVTYNHHEQACAIAAEAYARLENKIAAVCVTTGPGGTNAITGVVGGWLDSIPMFVVSGQVRYDTTARYALQFTETPLRAMGDQEYDIVKSVEPMTKFAYMVEDPKKIRWALEKGWHLATTGRPGPVWVDIPVNYQGSFIETDELEGYDPAEDDALLPPPVEEDVIQTVLEKIKNAKRPVFHAGYGIRLSGGYEAFRRVADKLNIPVSNLTKENIREELQRRGCSAEDAHHFTEIISRCDEAQYSPAESVQMSDVYAEGVNIISRIESIIKR